MDCDDDDDDYNTTLILFVDHEEYGNDYWWLMRIDLNLTRADQGKQEQEESAKEPSSLLKYVIFIFSLKYVFSSSEVSYFCSNMLITRTSWDVDMLRLVKIMAQSCLFVCLFGSLRALQQFPEGIEHCELWH